MATYGCIRARMGEIEYYLTKMTVNNLINSVGIAKEMPEWPDMNPEEKMQRECNIRRITEEIVPYIVNDKEHFFGSLIVDIYSGYDLAKFEPFFDVVSNIPFAYQSEINDIGFLTLPGKERLIALDGQHRLLALRIAVKGVVGIPGGGTIPQHLIKELLPHPEIGDEEVSVIFVKHTDTRVIRKIFNNINKYAKQTSRSDNIITSDDDIFAVIARQFTKEGEIFHPINDIEIVNQKNTSLSERSKNLTTLSALYNIADTLIRTPKLNDKTDFTNEQKELSFAIVNSFWKGCIENLDALKEYFILTKNNSTVANLRLENLLLKPVTQMALAHVARKAAEKNLSWNEICIKLNKIDWSFDNRLWTNILVIAKATKKVITGKDSIRQAGCVISYIVMGDKMTKAEIEEVRAIICNAQDNPNATLPEIIQ